jgi:hypothetical protein
MDAPRYRSAMDYGSGFAGLGSFDLGVIGCITEGREADVAYALTGADVKLLERKITQSRPGLGPWRLAWSATYFIGMTLFIGWVTFLDIIGQNYALLPRDLIFVYTGAAAELGGNSILCEFGLADHFHAGMGEERVHHRQDEQRQNRLDAEAADDDDGEGLLDI